MLTFALATTAPSAGPTGHPPAGSIQLWTYISDGGVLSYVLLGLSVLALTSMIYNALVIRRSRQIPPFVLGSLQGLFTAGDFEGARRFCQEQDQNALLTAIVGNALDRALSTPAGMSDFRTSVEAVAPPEIDRLHRNNDWLGILAAVGPMLGLLGTVIGMIGAFRTIGTLTGAQRSNELATFMSMALVNTAEGLIVAIPCTIAFALFRRRIDQLVDDASAHIERLAALACARTSSAESRALPTQTAATPHRLVRSGTDT
ncbi:MAG: MotA/TolQ/ExbB proton channel family protein [Phycisphaerales bacterium]